MLSWPVWRRMTGGQRIVWVTMLFEANWKATEVWTREGRAVVHRGEFITNQIELAKNAGVGRQTVRSTYVALLKEGAIRMRNLGSAANHQGNHGGNHQVFATTIVNYSTYQALKPKANQRPTPKRPYQNQGNQGNQEAFPPTPQNLNTLPPSDTRAGGRVIKLNPDDVLSDWDHELQRHVPRGLTAHGRDALRRGKP